MKSYFRDEILKYGLALTFDDVSLIPCQSSVDSREDVDISARLVDDHSILSPVVPTNMDTITEYEMMSVANEKNSIAFLHRFMEFENFKANISKYLRSNLTDPRFLGISIGLDKEYEKWIEHSITQLKSFQIPLIVMIDIANGYSTKIESVIKYLQDIRDRKYKNLYIIAGNVADYYGTAFLCKLGVDGIRATIGGGSACETRIRTGVGVPNLTSLIDCRAAITAHEQIISSDSPTKMFGPTLICDGGIKTPGDVAKAIAAGADFCLCGYLFAGTTETPGNIIKTGTFPNYKFHKKYKGSASLEMKDKLGKEGYVEGNSTIVPVSDSARVIFKEINDGLRSAFSYLGAFNAREFRENARFVIITSAGNYEGQPNILYR
jgi:IMP dehydrogenase